MVEVLLAGMVAMLAVDKEGEDEGNAVEPDKEDEG